MLLRLQESTNVWVDALIRANLTAQLEIGLISGIIVMANWTCKAL